MPRASPAMPVTVAVPVAALAAAGAAGAAARASRRRLMPGSMPAWLMGHGSLMPGPQKKKKKKKKIQC